MMMMVMMMMMMMNIYSAHFLCEYIQMSVKTEYDTFTKRERVEFGTSENKFSYWQRGRFETRNFGFLVQRPKH